MPLVYFDLQPMGTITAEAFDTLVGRMIDQLAAHGPWDAVLLALHGAAVSEVHRDVDGEIIERVRRLVGDHVPIGVTFDMHANVSARMIELPTVVNLYMTNPHLDARRRARQSADLTFRAVRGEITPVAAVEAPPLIVNILRQGTSDAPMRELVALATEAESRPGVLSVSIAEGFPYADVEEMGMAFVAVTDGDAELAASIAGELARAAWDVRAELQGDGVPIDDALARRGGGRSPPGGAARRGRQRRRRQPGRLDPRARGGPTARCARAVPLAVRPGARSRRARRRASVHGSSSPSVARPTPCTARRSLVRGEVRHLDDGRFEETGPTHGGKRFFDVGPRAVLHTDDDHTILLTTLPMGNTSRQELVSAGIDPLRQPVIVAKGVQSPRGAFEPIAAAMIQLNSPGCTSADVSVLEYRHRRRPMYPYEADATY